jgi:hypothetical protein
MHDFVISLPRCALVSLSARSLLAGKESSVCLDGQTRIGQAAEIMKPRPPNRRKIRQTPARDAFPPDVPEAVSTPAPPPSANDADPIPEHIRRMLEAAYT